MSEVNYKALMANDVSIMNLSENEIFSSFIVIDQNNKQYYAGAYDLDHLSDFVNANEPVSDFSAFQDTLRNYFFSTASDEEVLVGDDTTDDISGFRAALRQSFGFTS